MEKATGPQLFAIWTASCLCNDWPYIKGDGEKKEGKPIQLGGLALALCEQTHGAITPRQAIMEIPFQELLATLEDAALLDKARSKDADAGHVTEDDYEWFKEHYPELEIE